MSKLDGYAWRIVNPGQSIARKAVAQAVVRPFRLRMSNSLCRNYRARAKAFRTNSDIGTA